MPEYSDIELLKIFRQKGQANYAFDLIVRKYQERLYWHIRKLVVSHEDTDDVLQNTFIKAWKGLDSFREESKLFTWLYRIATNESLSFLKKKKIRNIIPIEAQDQVIANLKADTFFEGNDMEIKFQQALESLPPKQRLVFNMKYFDNMKYDDISAILKTSVGALKASYFHAVKKIENYIKDV